MLDRTNSSRYIRVLRVGNSMLKHWLNSWCVGLFSEEMREPGIRELLSSVMIQVSGTISQSYWKGGWFWVMHASAQGSTTTQAFVSQAEKKAQNEVCVACLSYFWHVVLQVEIIVWWFVHSLRNHIHSSCLCAYWVIASVWGHCASSVCCRFPLF